MFANDWEIKKREIIPADQKEINETTRGHIVVEDTEFSDPQYLKIAICFFAIALLILLFGVLA